jgi:Ca2+-transporting ATPase
MSDQDRRAFMKSINELASQGLRCLAIAEIPNAGALSNITKENKSSLLSDITKYDSFEQNAVFVGVVAIKDPIREEVKPAIQDCYTAGIRIIMITGDSKETAMSIAKELDIINDSNDPAKCVFTGSQFDKMSDADKKKAVGGETGKVFSRVEPAHKREIVKHLIDMGQIVAMTGDGVNDAPALKQAHIGIAMGIAGTEVAKSASDMILADDNFATIVKAVEEGRAIYSNMKAFIRYLISSNIGEVLSIFFTAMLGIPEGFSSVQLLWVNLVTDGPPATALGFNPPDFDIMKKPPRKADDDLISGWVLIRYCVVGVYVGIATVGIFIYWYIAAETGDGHTLVTWNQLTNWGDCPNWPKESFQPVNFIDGMDFSQNPCSYFVQGKVKASTLSLSVLVVIEMLNALNAISEDNSLLTMSPFINPYLLLAIAGSIGLHMMIVYVPSMATIFCIAAMNMQEWILVFAFSTPVIFIDEILKIIGRSMNEAELKERLSKKKKQ